MRRKNTIMNKINFYLFLSFLIVLNSCKSTKKATDQTDKTKPEKVVSSRVAFYNVENLFDLEDHPDKLDEDFTPTGKQKWTKERYDTKLDRIDQVMAGIEYPTFIGLCEIENGTVLSDLTNQKKHEKAKLQF